MKQQRVLDHYRDMRTFQTVAFYEKMSQKYSFEHDKYRRKMTIAQAFDELEHYVVRYCVINACMIWRIKSVSFISLVVQCELGWARDRKRLLNSTP